MGHGIEYRPYQVEAKEAAFSAFADGKKSALVVMPTGTGKTCLAGMCAEETSKAGLKTLFIAHREVLIEQAYKTFTAFGFNAAIEMGQNDARNHAAVLGSPEVVVGSIQTLQDDRLMRWNPEEFGLIIVDECHRALADSYTKTLNWFQGYNLLGITATPSRGDERNLGSRFETKAYEYRLRQAIGDGFLVPIETRECCVSVSLKGIKTVGGDFSLGELGERIGPHIEQLARAFIEKAGDRPSVCFLPDVGSAMFFADTLSALGVSARYVAGSGGSFGMPKLERKANLEAFRNREFQVVCCCELLIEGWDAPFIEAVGIVRPTQQQYRYTQMVGRGTRPSPDTGKENCLVIDFDWQTDKGAKDICSTVDLFDDGSINEDVFAMAKGLSKLSAGKESNPLELIEEAEKIIRTRERFLVRLTGKSEKFKTVIYDPVGVSKILNVKLNPKFDLDSRGTNPASKAQLGYLRSLGMTAPDSLSKWGASKMIDKILKRKDQGLASVSQVRSLLSSGVNSDMARVMTSQAAGEAIKELSAIRPEAQRMLF